MGFVSFLKGEGPALPDEMETVVAIELRESEADVGEHLVVFKTENGTTLQMPYRAFESIAYKAKEQARTWITNGRVSKISVCQTCGKYTTVFQRPNGSWRCKRCW